MFAIQPSHPLTQSPWRLNHHTLTPYINPLRSTDLTPRAQNFPPFCGGPLGPITRVIENKHSNRD